MSKRDSPYLRYAYNDLVRNKGVNAALFTVLILSAFLMATGAMVMERMFGAVDQLFEQAQPPHFLQMHKGDYDPEELDRFAAEQPDIEHWLVVEALGFDSAVIAWDRPSTGESGDLSDRLIDNLFVTQNEEFDYLIDQDGEIPQPSPGDVYVPVVYQQEFDLQIDDTLHIRTEAGVHDLTVRGFVRDAQMASSLSSATRFLISDEDFTALDTAGGGAPEIIVEYLLTDTAQAADLQRAYESNEALPKNGPAVTFDQIRIINAFSDGLVAVALVFVSFLLIVIALLNARFVIRGTLQEEVREIGAMKAIGLPGKSISSLYLGKYSVMTLLACIVGGVLAIGAANFLTRNVQTNYAEAEVGLASFLAPAIALVFVYLLVIAICRRVLGAVKRIQVVNALVHGSTLNDRQTARRAKRQARSVRRSGLASFRGENINRRLALLDLRADSRHWILVPTVFFIAAVLVTLPTNLLSTFESPRFVTYMGAPESDVLVALQFSEEVDALREDILADMDEDDRLSDVRVFAEVLYSTDVGEGPEVLRVEVGDYADDTIEYVEGGPPVDGQIALSVLNAEKYEVAAGDTFTVHDGDQASDYEVSGVYQDVTNGGKTAKMHGEITEGAAGYAIYADIVGDAEEADEVAADYDERFPGASIIPLRDYVQQTFSYLTDALRSAAIISLVFGVGVAVLITSLFLKLRLTGERRKMGTLSAIGFTTGEIIAQVRAKTVIAATAGTLLGLAFAATVGEKVVGAVVAIAGLGIAELEFMPNVLLVYVAYPLILIAAGYIGAVALTAKLRGVDKSSWLKG